MIDFPNNPSIGQIYSFNDKSWQWDGVKWVAITSSGPTGATGATGVNGPIGSTGETGASGPTGPIGATGATGPAGSTGVIGLQGTTGPTGPIGETGVTGVTGIQGATGVSGTIGQTGPIGQTGVTGVQGATGSQGATGAGETGATGAVGATGATGATGVSGVQGATGVGETGSTGVAGPTGATGPQGQSSSFYDYKAKTGQTTGNPGNTYLLWNNATQINSTQINVSHIDRDGYDIDILLLLLTTGDNFFIQDADNALNYQKWVLSGPVVDQATYVQIPVTLVASGGTGTTNFGNNEDVLFISAKSGQAGATGASGVAGPTGATGVQGATGAGETGATGVQGATGAIGATGAVGATGVGETGATGVGITGATGPAGTNGATGATGPIGATGPAGGGGGGASVTVATTPPSTPSEGDLWLDSDTMVMSIFYDSTWVEVGTSSAGLPPQFVQFAVSDEVTPLTVGTNKMTFRMPMALTLTGVRASLTTAQTSGNILTIDINEAGNSILSTKLTIDNTEKTSTTAATPAVISDANLADDAEITIDIDQVGNGTATGLKITLIGNIP